VKNWLALLLSVLLVSIPLFYRIKWNQGSVALGSDPQIKYYQAVQMNQHGISAESFRCIFPAQEMGFSVNQIPFGYPWAFLFSGEECFFQYPYLFSLVQYILGGSFFIFHLTFLPILFFFINFWITYFLFLKMDVDSKLSSIGSFLIHLFTPLSLSALDYSELTLTNLVALSVLFLFYESMEVSKRWILYPVVGFLFALNFQLRPESAIAIGFFALSYFILLGNFKNNFLRFLVVFCFLLLFTGAFLIINDWIYDHPLGMRGKNTLDDTLQNVVRNYWNDWKADLWGSDYKIGVFQGFPIVFLFLFLGSFFRFFQSSFGKTCFVSGVLFITLLPILSPYRAGVDIFGMRYFETGILLFGIGAVLLVKDIFNQLNGQNLNRFNKYFFYALLISILCSTYFSYKSVLRAIKQWNSGAAMSHQMYEEFKSIQPNLIVHRGLSLSYLVGVSYLDFPQIAIYNPLEWEKIESILAKRGHAKVLYLYWEGNGLFNKEIPQKIWTTQFDLNFEIEPIICSKTETKKILHFDAFVFDCNGKIP
jgi:hypothetical protein